MLPTAAGDILMMDGSVWKSVQIQFWCFGVPSAFGFCMPPTSTSPDVDVAMRFFANDRSARGDVDSDENDRSRPPEWLKLQKSLAATTKDLNGVGIGKNESVARCSFRHEPLNCGCCSSSEPSRSG